MSDDGLSSDVHEQKFYAAVGRAITAWADIEDVLFAITLSILGCSRDRAAIVFYRTPTIESRLTLTNDLIYSFFPKHEPGDQPDARIKRWREIQAKIREHLPVRNRLAHHPVGPVVDLRDDQNLEIIHASHISSAERLRKGEEQALEINDILVHRQIVLLIIGELRNFHRQEFRGSPSASGSR
jgi:hypothetical protein